MYTHDDEIPCRDTNIVSLRFHVGGIYYYSINSAPFKGKIHSFTDTRYTVYTKFKSVNTHTIILSLSTKTYAFLHVHGTVEGRSKCNR